MPNKLNVPAMWTPEMGAVVAKQNELAAGAYSTDQTFHEMRMAYNAERAFWNEGGPQPVSIRESRVATPHGQVTVRMYRPTSIPALPVIVYIHGGGWVVGNLDTHSRICRILAAESGAAVLAVDYTLSPEARYPQAVEECVAVVQHLRVAADEWNIDANDISLAGDSGGANMAFATYLHLRDVEKDVAGIRCLLLYYGSYGLRDSMSIRLFGGPWDGLTEEDFAWYKNLYLRGPEDVRAPYFDVLGNDLAGIPPCYIVAAALDPLRDDSRTLAAICEHYGVVHAFEEIPGVLHGFLHHSKMLPAAREVLESGARFFRTVRLRGGSSSQAVPASPDAG
ncbi:MAG: acetyl esterase [Actinomycetaceae bacterium]|jgi:acetyl esterase|nr:acetyl esterase [Actinomycetaceae bacterium]